MLTANSEGNTNVAELKDGAALQKDSFSAKIIALINSFKKKKKSFSKSKLKKTVCVDFDGVIHSYKSGREGIDDINDPIVPGAIDFLWELINSGYNVIIFSSRAKGEGIEAIKNYISENETIWRKARYLSGQGVERTYLAKMLTITNEKLPADIYIDDRAFQFKGVFPSLYDIDNFRSWVDFTKSSLKINLSDVNTDPTESQKESGNYKKAHVQVHGLDITIENPKGAYRSGTDPNGKKWKCKMHSHYGYFKRTEGKDGDHVDVFVGPNIESELVFIINQNNSKGIFDEHKVMLGFNTQAEAEEGYLKNYSKGWKGLGSIIPMTIDQFKNWIQSEDTKKPAKQFTKSQIHTELEWQTYFEKGRIAQVGETRTWSDGTVHKKTGDGKWVEVSSSSKKPVQSNSGQRPGSQAASQPKSHEQRAVETIDRWRQLEEKAKKANRERMAKTTPQNKDSVWNVGNAKPGDVIRIERASSGRINRGHIGEVIDKVDGFLKVALASGGIYLFPPNELAFAKGGNKSMDPNIKEFFKGVKAEIGEVRTWSDGNKYRKEASGWKLIGSGDKKAHQMDDKEHAKAGGDKASHKAAVEKAMEAGEKIPVKVLRQYPDLLKKNPVYAKRVSAIDAISRSLKSGSKVGGTLESSVESLKSGRLLDKELKISTEEVQKNIKNYIKQKSLRKLESIRPTNLDDIPQNDHPPIELTPEEKKKISKLTQKNLHTEALMVEANKHPNPYYKKALKEILNESNRLGHLASNLRKARDKIEAELRKKPISGNDILSK